MRATVKSVSGEGAATIVAFTSNIGSGKARWASHYGPPIIGAGYDVELDVWAPFDLVPARSTAGVELVEERILLTGLVESISEDDIACLRIAPDSIMEFPKGKHSISLGEMVTLRMVIDKFQLTPFGFPPKGSKN